MFLIRGIAKHITRTVSGVKSPEIYPISGWRIESAIVYRHSFQFPDVLTSDNLCLVMAKSRPSNNLLLNIPEVNEIREFLHIPENSSILGIDFIEPEVFDCTDWLLEGVMCSENYIEPFTPIKTFKYEKTSTVTPWISENLFHLLNIPDIFGHYYGSITKEQDSVDNKNNSQVRRKQNLDKIPTQAPSPWDLLKPVLLPPLSLEFPQELDFYSKLRGYQLQGISWLLDHPSALLADEMGTGKTVQAVNALRLLFRQRKIRSALIVCPPAVVGSVNLSIQTGHSEGWRGHFHNWASELEVAVMRGGNKEQRRLGWECPFHVYITTYDTLRGDIQKQVLSNCNKFDCIILDEAHKIKNRATKTSKAIRSLKSKYRWALTGTPIQNSLEDVKSLFAFIQPNILKDNIEYSPEITKQVIDPYMLRRLKQDVLKELPEKVHQEDWLKLNQDQKAAYNRVLQTGKKQIQTSLSVEAKNQVQSHILTLITELKKICNFATGKEESPKTELLLEYLETIAASNQKVLVFSQYKLEGTDKISKLLEKKGFRYVLYTGDTSERQKKQAINDFRSNPDITVFLATIKSAGEGLTLIEATYVIHFDHWWNPATMKQAEDRTHRIGQKSSVTVYSFWMEGTIEKRISDKLKEKRSLVENTVDELAVEAIDNWLSTEELLDILDIKPAVRTIEVEATPVDTPQPELQTQKNQQPTTTSSVKSSESTSSDSVEATNESQQVSTHHYNTVESSVSPSNQSIKSTTESEQMSSNRLRTVEENLEILRLQIAGKEKAKLLAAFEEQTRIEQGIQELRKQMRPYEEEYWHLIAIRSTEIEIAEPDAEIVVAEMVERVRYLKTSSQYPNEMLQILEKIYLEVSKPDTPAAAKLKGTVSMLPPFVSLGYETEVDTERFFQANFPTFTRWYKTLAKK